MKKRAVEAQLVVKIDGAMYGWANGQWLGADKAVTAHLNRTYPYAPYNPKETHLGSVGGMVRFMRDVYGAEIVYEKPEPPRDPGLVY